MQILLKILHNLTREPLVKINQPVVYESVEQAEHKLADCMFTLIWSTVYF